MAAETFDDTPPNSRESEPSFEREQVRSDVNNLIDEMAERCPDCDGKMTLGAIEAFCKKCLEDQEKMSAVFELSQPETKTYSLNEPYTFLVHVPKGDVAKRVAEIGSNRHGVLMASLLNETRQGTFLGYGGLLLEAPNQSSIKGISRVDPGGEIADGRMDSIDELRQPAPITEYNQIDMKFDGTRVIGVVLKVTPDGKELGNPWQNAQLREVAKRHNWPIVTLEVAPAEIPTKKSETKRDFANGNTLSTYDIPDGNDHLLRIDIAHGDFYHSPDIHTIARSMTIDRYGQVSQQLSAKQEQRIRQELSLLQERGSLSEQETKAVIDGFLPLK